MNQETPEREKGETETVKKKKHQHCMKKGIIFSLLPLYVCVKRIVALIFLNKQKFHGIICCMTVADNPLALWEAHRFSRVR